MPPSQDDAQDGLPRVVRRNPTKSVTKLCVNCLSPLERGSGLGGWLVPQDYYCKVCGYKGFVYLEDRRAEDAAAGRRERGGRSSAADSSLR